MKTIDSVDHDEIIQANSRCHLMNTCFHFEKTIWILLIFHLEFHPTINIFMLQHVTLLLRSNTQLRVSSYCVLFIVSSPIANIYIFILGLHKPYKLFLNFWLPGHVEFFPVKDKICIIYREIKNEALMKTNVHLYTNEGMLDNTTSSHYRTTLSIWS